MSDARVPRLVRGCRLGQGGILHLPEGILKLSPTGLKIVQLCDGKRSVDEVVTAAQAEFPPAVHDKIRQDIVLYLEQLVAKRAVDL